MNEREYTLDVCMIVRNEIANLKRAIESVREVATRVIVVDTGSTDGTFELAEGLGADVFRFTWTESFAEARNASFAQATSDWILMLDADQALESASALPRRLKGDAYRVRIVDSGVESCKVALFRAPARMVGFVHEMLWPPRSAPPLDVRLLHFGRIAGDESAKHDRYLPLLRREIEARPERTDIAIELARTEMALGDPTRLIELIRGVDLTRSAPPYFAMLFESALLLPQLRSDAELVLYAEREFPRSLPMLWTIARLAAESGDFPGAEKRLVKLIRLAENGEYDRAIGFDHSLLGAGPKLQLAGIRVRLGRLAEAEKGFAALVDDFIHGAHARANLEVVQRLKGRS